MVARFIEARLAADEDGAVSNAIAARQSSRRVCTAELGVGALAFPGDKWAAGFGALDCFAPGEKRNFSGLISPG